ncbi:hypothetical protein REPUB_Repub17cG0093700 [Reevesia pubescens]
MFLNSEIMNDCKVSAFILRLNSRLACNNFYNLNGVYANGDDLKKFLIEKYGNLSASELKDNKGFNNDLMEADICMTVRLQIVYSKLSIRSVHSAFEESIGS